MSTNTSIEDALLSAEFLADPYPTYQRLRTEAPVYWCESWKSWLISRYADIVAVHRDDGLRFSSANRSQASLALISDAAPESLALLNNMTGLFEMDPPQYTRLRGRVTKAFRARMVHMPQRITELVDAMLDAVQAQGGMDVIRDIAYPLPAIVVAEILGVPPENRDQFKQWGDGFIDLLASGNANLASATRAEHSVREAGAWLRGLAAERRAHPQEDVLSELVASDGQSQAISEPDLLATCFGFLIAGHETTTNLLGNGLRALLMYPQAMQQLRDHPELIPTAVEELLRYDSPLQRSVRIAKEDVEFGGQRIRQGQFVFTILGSANRDSAQFPAPDELDLRRQPNAHLAFGFGIHHCVGAPLARLEGAVAFAAILKRLPELQLAGGPLEWHDNIAFHGLKSLPVVFE